MTLRERLLQLLAANKGQLFKTNELSKMLRVKSESDEYQQLRDELEALTATGEILRGTRRRYMMPKPVLTEVTGELRIHTTGNGIVTPEAASGLEDTVLVRTRHLGTAMDGDTVRIRLHAPRTGDRPKGEIIEVLIRATHHIIGTLERTKQGYWMSIYSLRARSSRCSPDGRHPWRSPMR